MAIIDNNARGSSLASREDNYRCNAADCPRLRDDLRGIAKTFGVSLLVADKWRRRAVREPVDLVTYWQIVTRKGGA